MRFIENACVICYGKGHNKANCPCKTKSAAEPEEFQAKNKREYIADKL